MLNVKINISSKAGQFSRGVNAKLPKAMRFLTPGSHIDLRIKAMNRKAPQVYVKAEPTNFRKEEEIVITVPRKKGDVDGCCMLPFNPNVEGDGYCMRRKQPETRTFRKDARSGGTFNVFQNSVAGDK